MKKLILASIVACACQSCVFVGTRLICATRSVYASTEQQAEEQSANHSTPSSRDASVAAEKTTDLDLDPSKVIPAN